VTPGLPPLGVEQHAPDVPSRPFPGSQHWHHPLRPDAAVWPSAPRLRPVVVTQHRCTLRSSCELRLGPLRVPYSSCPVTTTPSGTPSVPLPRLGDGSADIAVPCRLVPMSGYGQFQPRHGPATSILTPTQLSQLASLLLYQGQSQVRSMKYTSLSEQVTVDDATMTSVEHESRDRSVDPVTASSSDAPPVHPFVNLQKCTRLSSKHQPSTEVSPSAQFAFEPLSLLGGATLVNRSIRGSLPSIGRGIDNLSRYLRKV
jgi:hypothetical protein